MPRAFDPQQPELMDRPQPVTPELEADLHALASLNRYFGSHRLIRQFLACWLSPGCTYRILDLATGGGDIPRVIIDWARQRDITLRIDAVDANESTLAIARRESRAYPEIEFIHADALRFDSPQTYDLVCCSLALHHFSEEDAVRLLHRCRSLSHRFVLVADLERSPATLLAIQTVTALFYREPMTRADAITSARRAFSFSEFRALAEAAQWSGYQHARFLFCRQALWLDEQRAAEILIPTESVEGLPCPT